ncbi:MAG: DUF4810 domain-containing protein [Bacteroidales bacterium]|nr:DUF4810 domain-containing protein [Bacteroidales bacterium]
MKDNRHNGVLLFLGMSLLITLVACSGQYKGIPREEMLAYHTKSTYGSLYELADAYSQSINSALNVDTLHPGMYADYGVALALMGHEEEGCRMLNAEAAAFPQSGNIMRRIALQLMPSCRIDTTVPFKPLKIDTAQLHRWAYDSVTALRRLPSVASVIDSTDTSWVAMQTPTDSVERPVRLTAKQKREMLFEQQAEAERQIKAHNDSIAAEKQAKIDARKQMVKDKKKEKKEKEKAKKLAKKEKEKAKKAAKKERERAAKERKAQREREKQERDAANKARKEQNKKGGNK